ncbi:MAG: dethiobiotin synthase [Aeromicrobium sp.]
MTRYITVTGTDTGVGKTIVTAALVAKLDAQGFDVVAVKPVQTGLKPGEPGDADDVARLSGVEVREMARLEPALAPETAARLEGVDLPTVDQHVERIRALGHDVVIIEGAGGVLVRLDLEGGTIIDIARSLDAEVVVVTRETLGTLNHTGLTVDRLRDAGIDPALIIGSAEPDPGLEARSNHADLPRLTGCPITGRIPAGAGSLPPADFRNAAPEWFSPA